MFAKYASLLVVAILISSCSSRAVPSVPPPLVTGTPVSFGSDTPVLPSTAPASRLVFPSASAPSTPAPEEVTVAAVKGNLYVRRGPDVAFDPVAVLSDGQRSTALARDVLGKWLQIPVPGRSEKTGWVSIQTIYSAVNGDVSKLPEVEPTDYPIPAFLRNCTFHDMVAEPGGILIPDLSNFPANDVRINPGSYRVYDNDADGYPEVLKVELREGSSIDIRTDGNGDKRKCPVP